MKKIGEIARHRTSIISPIWLHVVRTAVKMSLKYPHDSGKHHPPTFLTTWHQYRTWRENDALSSRNIPIVALSTESLTISDMTLVILWPRWKCHHLSREALVSYQYGSAQRDNPGKKETFYGTCGIPIRRICWHFYPHAELLHQWCHGHWNTLRRYLVAS